MNLSEQPPVAEEASTGVEAVSLDAQLEAVTAERDRHAKDKIELITKASALSRELDAARAQLASAAEEKDTAISAVAAERDGAAADRDRLRAELASVHDAREKAAALATQATAEVAYLKDRLAAAGSPDPLVVLADFLREKTKAGVAWTRTKIPEGHPALPWFDRTVEGVATAGRLSADFLRWLAPRLVEAYQWAKPRALQLYAKAKSEIEARIKQS